MNILPLIRAVRETVSLTPPFPSHLHFPHTFSSCKCFTWYTKTFANLTTYSRKPGNYNGTIIFENDIMKNSSPLNLKFTLFAMSKPKQQFFSAGLTALSAQLRVNQNKRNNQNNCEKVKFVKDLN